MFLQFESRCRRFYFQARYLTADTVSSRPSLVFSSAQSPTLDPTHDGHDCTKSNFFPDSRPLPDKVEAGLDDSTICLQPQDPVARLTSKAPLEDASKPTLTDTLSPRPLDASSPRAG